MFATGFVLHLDVSMYLLGCAQTGFLSDGHPPRGDIGPAGAQLRVAGSQHRVAHHATVWRGGPVLGTGQDAQLPQERDEQHRRLRMLPRRLPRHASLCVPRLCRHDQLLTKDTPLIQKVLHGWVQMHVYYSVLWNVYALKRKSVHSFFTLPSIPMLKHAKTSL